MARMGYLFQSARQKSFCTKLEVRGIQPGSLPFGHPEKYSLTLEIPCRGAPYPHEGTFAAAGGASRMASTWGNVGNVGSVLTITFRASIISGRTARWQACSPAPARGLGRHSRYSAAGVVCAAPLLGAVRLASVFWVRK